MAGRDISLILTGLRCTCAEICYAGMPQTGGYEGILYLGAILKSTENFRFRIENSRGRYPGGIKTEAELYRRKSLWH